MQPRPVPQPPRGARDCRHAGPAPAERRFDALKSMPSACYRRLGPSAFEPAVARTGAAR